MNKVDEKPSNATTLNEDGSASPQRAQDLPDSRQKANSDALAALPPLRKNLLYIVLILTIGSHNLGISCLFTTSEAIAAELHLEQGGNAIWLISSYAMAFAACIPLGGRLADISKPQWCFLSGLIGMAGLTLGHSFVHGGKLFIALRALEGICAALAMPSCFSMIVSLFPNKKEQTTRLLAASIMSALGAVSGFIFPVKLAEVIKQLDVVGVMSTMACLLLFSLALTSATVYGWTSARFIAPFVVSIVLVPIFCWWESKQSEERAMVPVAIMKQKRFLVVCFSGIAAEMWFVMVQLGPSRYSQQVLRDSSILVAGKLSPTIIGALVSGLLHTFYIAKHFSAKHRLLVGLLGGAVPSLVLVVVSNGGKGMDYWKFLMPGFLTGSFFIGIVFQVTNVLVIQSVPATYSGIASSIFTMSLQIGTVIGSSVQAGLYTAAGDISNWRGSQYGFYFLIAWLAVAFLLVAWLVPHVGPNDEEGETQIK